MIEAFSSFELWDFLPELLDGKFISHIKATQIGLNWALKILKKKYIKNKMQMKTF